MIGGYGFPEDGTAEQVPAKVEAHLYQFQTTCSDAGLSNPDTFVENCGAQQVNILKGLKKYDNIQNSTERQPNLLTNPICIVCKPKFRPIRKKLTINAEYADKAEKCFQNPNFEFCPFIENTQKAQRNPNQKFSVELKEDFINNGLYNPFWWQASYEASEAVCNVDDTTQTRNYTQNVKIDMMEIEMVTKCEEITFCSFSNTFDRCDECENGYAFYNRVEDLGLICSATTIKNCFILEVPASITSEEKCKKCKKGYILNKDFRCDEVNVYGCKTQGFYDLPTNLSDVYQYFFNGVGCQECDPDSLLITLNLQPKLCIKNEDLNPAKVSEVKQKQADSNYFFSEVIFSCQIYSMNNSKELICQKCVDGFLPQTDRKQCHEIKELAKLINCQFTEKGGTICQSCNDLYYLDTIHSQCVLGSINHCVTYLNKDNCQKCEEQYVHTQIKGSKTLCFSIEEFNCEEIDYHKAQQSGSLNCLKCKPNYYLTSNNIFGSFSLNQCVQIPVVERCESYQKGQTAKDSFLNCEQCEDDYYLTDTGQCKIRVNTTNLCKEYEINEDKCLDCSLGYYLSTEKTKCLANPNSIPGCNNYTDIETCIGCQINMFLKENRCFFVLDENLIPHCNTYKNNTECLQCQQKYFLQNNECNHALANNCKTYVDQKTCKTCLDNFGLEDKLEIDSCIEVFVAHCELPDYLSIGPDFKCLKCNKFFYLNSDRLCEYVDDLIQFCEYYYNLLTCSQCEEGYILTNEGKKCQSLNYIDEFKDPKCQNLVLEYTCATCQLGYYMKENECSICEESNCMFCVGQGQCQVCKSGFYMDENFHCLGTQELNPDIGENVEEEGIKIILWSWFVLVLLWTF